MKVIKSYRKEDKNMSFVCKTTILPDFINKKIEKDIELAKKDRLNGDMGTPIEEVLINMKKIIEGESL